jgi:hypothetical protein
MQFLGQLSMEGIDLDQFMTQKNDCEILANKRPTKALQK